jgi:hypothetical protein
LLSTVPSASWSTSSLEGITLLAAEDIEREDCGSSISCGIAAYEGKRFGEKEDMSIIIEIGFRKKLFLFFNGDPRRHASPSRLSGAFEWYRVDFHPGAR